MKKILVGLLLIMILAAALSGLPAAAGTVLDPTATPEGMAPY